MDQPTPIPQQVPRVISTSMGSVFGNQVQGYPLPIPRAAIEATQVKQTAIGSQEHTPPPTIDVLSQIDNLKSEILLLKVEMDKIKAQITPVSTLLEEPKKARGRPKKVAA